ncbi:hypothetical protein N480_17905 [Pseudoalteromonas luteoviolacea S2607]|uniref:tyrosine-type recombinase/integrase n=1 Tax=Pseudoalteromonas luteoviolacea TaxID=43657 RepID=UPI0007B06371|nr:site-specific integrase [Pseudoalteromonas luteoviolacea]KZN36351.1 hypothetical protein N480_17905 [Pseudoalteromonas luteoviolacea S2607]
MRDRLSQLLKISAPKTPNSQLAIQQQVVMADLIVRDDDCPMYAYINGLSSDASKATARRVLMAICKSIGFESIYDIHWEKINKNDINQMFNVWKMKKLSPDTVSLYCSVIKSVMKEAFLLEKITTLQYESIKHIKKPQGSRIRQHHTLAVEDFTQLLGLIEGFEQPKITTARDQAIFHILVGAGLRRFEVVGLRCEDIDHENKRIKFIGKGNKERAVKLHDLTYCALNNWLKLHPTGIGSIFIRLTKSGRIYYKMSDIQGLSGHAIYDVCKKYGLLSGAKPTPPHSLRRSYATWLYTNGADLKHISLLLGHASIKTTERYIQTTQSQIDGTVTENLFK